MSQGPALPTVSTLSRGRAVPVESSSTGRRFIFTGTNGGIVNKNIDFEIDDKTRAGMFFAKYAFVTIYGANPGAGIALDDVSLQTRVRTATQELFYNHQPFGNQSSCELSSAGSDYYLQVPILLESGPSDKYRLFLSWSGTPTDAALEVVLDLYDDVPALLPQVLGSTAGGPSDSGPWRARSTAQGYTMLYGAKSVAFSSAGLFGTGISITAKVRLGSVESGFSNLFQTEFIRVSGDPASNGHRKKTLVDADVALGNTYYIALLPGATEVGISIDAFAVPTSFSWTFTRSHIETDHISKFRVNEIPKAPTVFSVGVASAVALAANTNRRGAAFMNTSNNRISFGIGQAAVLDSGITLLPGGVWEMDERSYSDRDIRAIASAASSNLSIQEWST